MDRLSEIRARCDAATPGPWEVKVKGNTVESHQVMSPGNGPICSAISPKTKNAQFIAHAREDIPYLLAEIEQANEIHKREIIITGEYAQHVIDLTARAEKAEAERDKAAEFIRWVDDNFSHYMPQEYTDRLMTLERDHFKPQEG